MASGTKWRAANADRVAPNRERREAYAASRGSLDRVCVNPDCLRAFTASRKDMTACSRKCRVHAAWLRK
jgi:hypothetical protein